jgi:SAM-dependent methyltransferase
MIKRLLELLERLWIEVVDFFLNINTVPPARAKRWLGDSSAPYTPPDIPATRLHADYTPYASPNYLHLWRICRLLKAGPQDVLYDLGCGMGRVICVMARGRAGKCVGVELSPGLCEVARENAVRLRGRKASVEIVCGDAAAANLSGGTIYFMFNPFGSATLKQVLAGIEASRSDGDRAIAVVYYNAVHAELLNSCAWLTRIDGFSTFTGRPVTIWGNRLWQERAASRRSARSM